uniref:Uncharacterized protein n=1 Tax=Zea mays TaxID=4577 RepID=C4J524_MAIZE|nr:unknown [Zea mays]
MRACSARGAAAAVQSPAAAAASVAGILPQRHVQAAGLLRGLPHPVGRAAPDAVAGRQVPDALDGQQLGQRVQVCAGVPERLLRRVRQGAAGVHRRRQHRLLPVEQRGVPGAPRRDRHGAAGDGAGGAVHAADQRVRARQRRRHHRRPGDAVPPLVRPHRRLPPLRHHLEPRPDPVPGGRRARQAVREEGGGHVP